MNEKQELWCHNCDKYVQFEIDMELNGNHVLNCPNCNHEHCRVVKDGIITNDRWAQRNGNTYLVTTAACTTTSMTMTIVSASTTTGAGAMLFAGAWANTTVA